MKQLNALGARRHQFFRAPHHRLRPLLLPTLADDLLDVHNDLYVAARQPPAFAYFAGDFLFIFYSPYSPEGGRNNTQYRENKTKRTRTHSHIRTHEHKTHTRDTPIVAMKA